MKKILIVNTVPFGMGGMSSVIVNYLKNMNKQDMKITLIVNSKIEDYYKRILKENNIKLVILRRNYRIIEYIYKLFILMKKEKFDVIHIHGNSSTMAFETIPAYLNNIENIIVHCHNVSCKHKILNKILWPILNYTCNLKIACSKQAGEWLYGKERDFLVLNNAIELENYKYNENVRNNIREELEIGDSYLIGHVGYFNEQKNHEKLFEIVYYLKNEIDIKLLCISGSYDVPDNIKSMIEKYNLRDNVKILLRKDNVNELLQAIDIFVFPSKYEGLGLALIEAQATGLTCIASNNIPKETNICNDLVSYYDLLECSSKWANLILNKKNKLYSKRENNSYNSILKLRNRGYDIKLEAEKLRKIYMNKSYFL